MIFGTEPRRINFGQLKKGSSYPSKYISVIGTEKDSTKLLSVKSKNKNIKVAINASGFDNDTNKRIKVSVLPGMGVGRFKDRITIQTDNDKAKKLKLSLHGEILGNIMISPRHLSFTLGKGKRLEKTVVVKTASGKNFKILNVKSTIPDLTISTKTVKEGEEYQIKVMIREDLDKKFLRGKIIITTDDKDQEEIEVKVFGRERKSRKKLKKKKEGTPAAVKQSGAQ